jgi:hypothetical protein
MSFHKFPVYRTHQEARCFDCGAPIDANQIGETQYPEGRGHWRGGCPTYCVHTWYDIEFPRPGTTSITHASG